MDEGEGCVPRGRLSVWYSWLRAVGCGEGGGEEDLIGLDCNIGGNLAAAVSGGEGGSVGGEWGVGCGCGVCGDVGFGRSSVGVRGWWAGVGVGERG